MRIVIPPGDPNQCDLSGVGRVYEPYVLRRSLLILRDRPSITLPSDIEPLVEHVYAEAPGAFTGRLREEHEDFQRTREDQERLAKQRVWPSPQVKDDPFADMHAWFEEEDPDVARALRAETRLGDDSIEVVCLFGSEQDAYLDIEREHCVDLGIEPSRDSVRSLARRTVRVARRGLVQAVRALPPPQSWRKIATLQPRRPLFFGGGPVRVGSFVLDLDLQLGLVIERE